MIRFWYAALALLFFPLTDSFSQTTFYQDVLQLDSLLRDRPVRLVLEGITPDTTGADSTLSEGPGFSFSLGPVLEIKLISDPTGQLLDKEVLIGQYFGGPSRTYALPRYGRYQLAVKDPDFLPFSFLIIYEQDTLRASTENFLVEVENAVNFVRVLPQEEVMTDPAPYLRKPSFGYIYGVLGRHVKALKNTDGEVDFYQMADAFAGLTDNPFMGSWLDRNSFAYLPYPNPLTDSTLQEVRYHLQHFGPSDQQLQEALLQDTVRAALLSVKEIELSYREPLNTSASQLDEISDNIKVKKQTQRDPFDPSVLASGFSDFIVERAQEEFNISFLERLRSQLNEDRFQELRVLFPQTHQFFTRELELTRYKTLLPMAKQSFLLDMESLGLNFPSLLNLPKYEEQKDAPAVFNLALFYELSNLVYQGADMEEIMQRGYQRLARRQDELNKKINLKLAVNSDSLPEIQQLHFEVDTLSRQLSQLGDDITEVLFDLETSFTRTVGLARRLDSRNEDTTRWTQAATQIFRNYRSESVPRLERFYDWFGIEKVSELDNIPANLEGRLYYDRILSKPTLQQYPEIFSSRPDPQQLIATGLELSKNLVEPSGSQDGTVIQYLVDLYRYLLGMQTEVQQFQEDMRRSTQAFFLTQIDVFQAQREELITTLQAEAAFWENMDARAYEHEIAALRFLGKTLDPGIDTSWVIETGSPDSRRQLEAAKSKLRTVLRYAQTKMLELENLSDAGSPNLAVVETMLNPPPPPEESFSEIEAFIGDIQSRARRVNTKLNQLDQSHHPNLIQARENAAYFGKGLEITSNLMYALRYEVPQPDGTVTKKWINRDDFRQLLSNQRRRDLFLGLIYNQLSSIEGTPQLSSQGVASLTTKFINVLNEARTYRDSLQVRSKNGENLKFAAYFPLVRFSVDMINDIIQTPLVNDAPLFPGLQDIPHLSNQTLSLFENVYNQEYGYAVYNALELFKIITDNAKDRSRNAERLRNNILLYGTFVANVANARQPDDMKQALVAAALPPGSSRIKRENPFNMSINSYLSLGAGSERLTSAQIPSGERNAPALSLSIPLGIATSWKFNPEDAFSYTFYLPIIDLGALTSYRIDGNLSRGSLPELELQNLLAPGGYFFVNFPNTPFSLGSGVQYGPQLRQIDITGSPIESSSWRWMIFGGVDVPIFNISTGN